MPIIDAIGARNACVRRANYSETGLDFVIPEIRKIRADRSAQSAACLEGRHTPTI